MFGAIRSSMVKASKFFARNDNGRKADQPERHATLFQKQPKSRSTHLQFEFGKSNLRTRLLSTKQKAVHDQTTRWSNDVQAAKETPMIAKNASPTQMVSVLKKSLKWLDNYNFQWKILKAQEKEEILRAQCPFYEHLSQDIKLPMNPCSGEVDFRFLDKPFLDDPVRELMQACTPNRGNFLCLKAVSGAGKTGAVFAYARKYFTIYVKASDYESIDPDPTFQEFNKMIAIISKKKSSDMTDYAVIACQLLWLSHAIVLYKVRNQYGEQFKPEHWLPYIMSGGFQVVNKVLHHFRMWYAELLNLKPIDAALISFGLYLWLNSLTEDVAFAIDEAQIAQRVFPHVPIISLCGEPRGLLSALSLYSLPSTQTRIVIGTRMTNFEQIPEGGESAYRDVPLRSQYFQFPVASPEDAVTFVTQFYHERLANDLDLRSQIGLFAQGRMQRSANLNKFIFNAKPNIPSPQLQDYIKAGLEDMKTVIKNYVEKHLNALENKFKTDTELHKQWRDWLKTLFVCSSIGDLQVSDKKCTELGINIDDLGFASVKLIDEEHYISIEEPYSFEVFRSWLKEIEAPFIDEYELDLKKLVGSMHHANCGKKGYAFECLVAALTLQFPNTDKIQHLPILKGVVFDDKAPDWLNQPFQNNWTRVGSSMEHSAVFSTLIKTLKQIRFNKAKPEKIQVALKGTILEKLFSDNKARNKLVIDALKKIMVCQVEYWGELLLLLTQYENELLLPSKYYGPDVIGFYGGILFKIGIYLHSPKENRKSNLPENEKNNKDKFTKNYLKDGWRNYPNECGVALEAIKAVSNWNELHLDIGIPRSNYTQLPETSVIGHSDKTSLWIQLSEEHVMQIVNDRDAFKRVLSTLGIPLRTNTTTTSD